MAARRRQIEAQRGPPDLESIRREREMRFKEIQLETVIKNFVTYLLYVFILLFLAYNNRDPHSFHVSLGVQNLFVTEDFNGVSIC